MITHRLSKYFLIKDLNDKLEEIRYNIARHTINHHDGFLSSRAHGLLIKELVKRYHKVEERINELRKSN